MTPCTEAVESRHGLRPNRSGSKNERASARTFLSLREPPKTWQQANLALLAQATELLESINTNLDSHRNVVAKIALRDGHDGP